MEDKGAKVEILDEAPKDVLLDITNAMLEMPTCYKVSGHIFYLYPPSLGVTMLMGNVMKEYDFAGVIEENQSIIGLYKLFQKNKSIVTRLLALCSFENRKDATKQDLVEKRMQELEDINAEDGLALVMRAINTNSDYDEFVKYYGIDKEYNNRKRVYELKEKDRSGITFGGLSMWGALIGVACERYGWTMDYVLWGISALNMNMLLADSITSVYLSEDEQKQIRVPKKNTINADDPRNAALIKALLADD